MPKSHFYPIYVNLQNKPVLVVGGGTVAFRKVKALLEHGAVVRIISPKLLPELAELLDSVRCTWIGKEYSSDDLQDSLLVFSCTEDEGVNGTVAKNAGNTIRLVNVADDPEKCTFIVPSILEHGDLSIAVSTGGSSPGVARQIRVELEERYGEAYKEYLTLLKNWRKEVKTKLSSEKKERFLDRVTDGVVLQLIKNGQLDEAKGVVEKCFQSLSD